MLIQKTYKHLLKLLKQLEYHVEKYKYKMYQQETHQYHHRHHHHQHHHHHSSLTVLGVMSVMLMPALLPLKCVGAVGYSYTRFTGPVTGPEHKVYVNDVTHRNPYYKGSVSTRLDYVAKPEYEFSYGVEDADAHVLHNRNEVRDGDAVKGVYSLIDPDGALRVVKYTADETNGFQAEVIRNGISTLHGQLKNENEFAEQNPKLIRNNNKYYSKDDKDEQQHYAPTPSSSLHSLPKWDQQPQKYPQPSLLSQYNPTKPEKWSSSSSSSVQYNRPKIEQQQQQHLPQPLSTAQYNRPKVEKWPSSAQYNAPSVSTQYNPSKFKQWQQVSHQRPYNQFKQQTPSTTVRNYNDHNNNNYNKINIDDGIDNGNDDDDETDEEEQPHYEVHEKPNHEDDDDHESEQEEDDKEDDEDVGDNEKYQQQQQQQPQHHSQLPSSLLQYNPVKWEQHYTQPPPLSSFYKPAILVQPQYKPQYSPPKLQQWQHINQQPPYDQYNHYQRTTPAPLITYSDYNFNNYNKNNTDDKYNADDKANIDDADASTGQYGNDNDVDVDVSEEPQSQTEVNKPGKDIVVIITNKKKKKPFSKKDGNKDDDDDDDDDYDDEDDSSDEDDDDDDSDEFEEYDEAVRKPHNAEYY